MSAANRRPGAMSTARSLSSGSSRYRRLLFIMGCSVTTGTVPYALLALTIDNLPAESAGVDSPPVAKPGTVRGRGDSSVGGDRGENNGGVQRHPGIRGSAAVASGLRGGAVGGGGGGGDGASGAGSGDSSIPGRLRAELAEAFDKYTLQLKQDVAKAIDTKMEPLKTRYAATGVSKGQVGWLAQTATPSELGSGNGVDGSDASKPRPVVDDTATFMRLVEELQQRREEEAKRSGMNDRCTVASPRSPRSPRSPPPPPPPPSPLSPIPPPPPLPPPPPPPPSLPPP